MNLRDGFTVLPKYAELELPLLRELLRRGGAAQPRDLDDQKRTVYDSLADRFNLSTSDRKQATSDTESRPKWENMVRWARQKLLDRGLLDGSKHGLWKVSDDGLAFFRADLEALAEAASAPQLTIFPDEFPLSNEFFEGSLRQAYVNVHERSSGARTTCIAHYGPTCFVCNFNFGQVYGPLAEGFIHVHHLVPLSRIQADYQVDPILDLRPVCPNCHAVIHLKKETRSIEEVKKLLAHAVLAS